MKTKIVYVLVSSDNDIYLEQAWVSIFSLRHFNKDVKIEVICDDKTAVRIKLHSPKEFRDILGEVISVPFDAEVSNKERSRWLKTSMRSLVKGDFLFLDTDTIVTGNLDDVDSFDFDIGMVYDWHCRLIDRPNKDGVKKRVARLFADELKEGTDYYNSGVIFSKDTEKSHVFFKRWHDRWNESKVKPKGIRDQQSLMVTVNELGGVIPMSGDYNCQPIVSMRYLATAKIVHFFNTRWDSHIRCPFYADDFFLKIKEEGSISEANRILILACRSTFVSPSMTICGEDINIWRSSSFNLLRKLYKKHKNVYRIINLFSRIVGGAKDVTASF